MGLVVEKAALLTLIAVAAVALMPLHHARRYLLIVVSGIAVGAWFAGFVFGARHAANVVAGQPQSGGADAVRSLHSQLPSPLWGVGLGIVLVLTAYLAFREDVRRRSGEPDE